MSGSRFVPDVAPPPPGRRYAASHLWVAEAGGGADAGIDGLLAALLPPLSEVVVAPAGTRLRSGAPCAWAVLDGRPVALPAPVAGEVEAPNAALRDRPNLLRRDPYGEGRLLRLRPAVPVRPAAGPGRLLADAVAARRLRRDHRLARLVAARAARRDARAAADGGVPVDSLYALLGPAAFLRLFGRLTRPTP